MTENNLLHRRDFEDVIPLLVSTYMRGCLVPFLGAGMSVKKLALWQDFVRKLEDEAGVTAESDEQEREKHLEVRAQRACEKIRNSYGRKCFQDSIGRALWGTSQELPPQTAKLASIRWPLVVSTNYDDLYFGSCLLQCSEGGKAPRRDMDVQVLGRSPKDCKMVLAALHGPFDRQYIWHVQGFLGGQFGGGIEESVADLEALRDQLVVGHAQYRLVTNASPHFRRCFGEMFSSRSFLFLGSSLSEEYFLNLFGEVLELRGPSSVPHFAFVRKGSVDPHFLADQMNITVCEFDKYEDLAGWLERLKTEIDCPQSKNTSWSFATRSTTETQGDLEVLRADVSINASPNAAIAFVARRDPVTNLPILPSGFTFDDPEHLSPRQIKYHIFQYGNKDLYAVTARCTDKEDDGAVADAVRELLDAVARPSEENCECPQTVHLQLSPTAGTVPPVFAFMECVRAFGEWKQRQPGSQLRLILHVQFDVAFNLTSNRISVQELLSSELIRFWAVVVADRDREPTRRILHYKKDTKLQEIFDELDVPSVQDAVEWTVSTCPSPRRDQFSEPTWLLRDRTLQSIGVVFGSILTLERGDAECGPVSLS